MRRSRAVPLGRTYLALAALAATSGVAACGSDEENNVYCADETGVIVDDYYCDEDYDDDDGDGIKRKHFLWIGAFGAGLKPGHKLSGGQKIAFNDAAARSKYGLPSSGRVTNGKAVTGGFGSGKSGGSSGG